MPFSSWKTLRWSQSLWMLSHPSHLASTVPLLHPWGLTLFTVVVSPQANVGTIADLAGKRVSLGPPGSGTRATSEIVLAAHGLRTADLAEVAELKFVEMAPALCEHRVDAFMFVATHPNPVFVDATSACGGRFVGLEEGRIRALLAAHPGYRSVRIPVDLYRGGKAAVTTVATTSAIVVDEALSDDVAYVVTRSVFENLPDFQKLYPALAGVTLDASVQTLLPLHPGAAAYFRETGALPGGSDTTPR